MAVASALKVMAPSTSDLESSGILMSPSTAASSGRLGKVLTPKPSNQHLSRLERSGSAKAPSRHSSNIDLRNTQTAAAGQLHPLSVNYKSNKPPITTLDDRTQTQPTSRATKIGSSSTAQLTSHAGSDHPFFKLPIELQSAILKYLPYRSLLALRLVSHYFSNVIIPPHVLTSLRKAIIADSIAYERRTLGEILKVPGVKSRWNRFWYQDPFYLSYLLWKLEQGDNKLGLMSFRAMEQLRCYICLEMKGAFTGEYVRKFSARSRGLGGTRADTRMCKECMIRKCISGLHGRWWKEGYWRDCDIVRIRQTHLPQKLKKLIRSNKKGSLEEDCNPTSQQKENGVCAKCRSERYALYWGCASCFDREEKARQTLDKQIYSRRQQKAYDFKVHMAELKDSWYRYSGMRPSGSLHFSLYDLRRAFDPRKLKHLRNLIGGRDLWLYLDWKARQRRYERKREKDQSSENNRQTSNIQAQSQQENVNVFAPVTEHSFTIGMPIFSIGPTLLDPNHNEASTTLAAHSTTTPTTPAHTGVDRSDNPSSSCNKSSDDSWSPYPKYPPLRCSNFEVRCVDCWRYNRPYEFFVSAIYENLRFERMCNDCRHDVVIAQGRTLMYKYGRYGGVSGGEDGLEGLDNLFTEVEGV